MYALFSYINFQINYTSSRTLRSHCSAGLDLLFPQDVIILGLFSNDECNAELWWNYSSAGVHFALLYVFTKIITLMFC